MLLKHRSYSKLRIFSYSEVIHSFFLFLCSNVFHNNCHKQKWRMLFFTCIKLVPRVLPWNTSIQGILFGIPKEVKQKDWEGKVLSFLKGLALKSTQLSLKIVTISVRRDIIKLSRGTDFQHALWMKKDLRNFSMEDLILRGKNWIYLNPSMAVLP